MHFLLVMPVSRARNFHLPLPETPAFPIDLLGKVLALVLIFSSAFFSGKLLQQLTQRDPFWLLFSRLFIVSLTLYCLLLMLIWPGYWVWDDLNILAGVRRGEAPSWQHIFTALYYSAALNLFPSAVGLVLLQVTIAALVFAFVTAKVVTLFGWRLRTALIFLPFFSFPVILNIYYPLRLSLYSYALLFLLIKIYLMAKRPRAAEFHVAREIILLTPAIVLVIFWRSEGVIYAAALGAMFFLLRPFINRQNSARVVVASLVLALALALGNLATVSTANPSYQLTVSINPLSMMLQDKLGGQRLTENLAALDRVVDLRLIRSMPDATEVPSFWSGGVRQGFEEHLAGYNKAFVNLIRDNPGSFFHARIETFLFTNGLIGPVGQNIGSFAPKSNIPSVKDFVAKDSIGAFPPLLGYEVRELIIKSLLLVQPDEQPTLLRQMIWTIVPLLGLLILLVIFNVVIREWAMVLIISLLLMHAMTVFLTAPADYFMYYLPVYLVGFTFSALSILQLLSTLDNRVGKSSKNLEP